MSTALADPLVRVIVCGNADRGDDGVAAATMTTLLPSLPADLVERLDIRPCRELRVEDLVDLPTGGSCLILDAVVGVEAGTIVVLSLVELRDRRRFTPRSSHQLPIELVIGLAGILRAAPVAGTFIGVAGSEFGFGAPLSGAVRTAMPAFGAAIAAELESLGRRAVVTIRSGAGA